MENTQVPLLRAEHLVKYYPVKGGLITHTVGQVHAVDDVSFTIGAGAKAPSAASWPGWKSPPAARCTMRAAPWTS